MQRSNRAAQTVHTAKLRAARGGKAKTSIRFIRHACDRGDGKGDGDRRRTRLTPDGGRGHRRANTVPAGMVVSARYKTPPIEGCRGRKLGASQ